MTKVVEWFGFKLHLIVDVKHEVVLSYKVTDTKAGDGETLPVVLEQAEANLPRIGSRPQLTTRRPAHRRRTLQLLCRAESSNPNAVAQLWQIDPERMLPGHDSTSNVVYDEAGRSVTMIKW